MPDIWRTGRDRVEGDQRQRHSIRLARAGLLWLICTLLAVAGPMARAQETDDGHSAGDTEAADSDCQNGYLETLKTSVRAYRLDEPINLDGVLDEAVWQNPDTAPLVQNDPDNGCPPRHDTDWWIAYDDEAIYLGARMHDSAPDSIVARKVRRDDWTQSDWLFLNLDTFNDDRNGFSFRVNPAGSIGDAYLYNDGWDDDSWDAVWEVATLIDDGGWNVEMRIPFSQINFPDEEEQVWGINVSRRTVRYNERAELMHRPRGASGYIRRFPDLLGINGIDSQRKLELLPYLTARGEFLNVDPEDPFRSGADAYYNAGLDLKYGLSSNLNLTATFNPDFGQVEVDPAVVNLSDTETFYSEKRPFFVKDANIFRFGSEGTNNNWSFNWMDPMLFYSRRVGRTPQLSRPEADYLEPIGPTTILGAGKISGKVGDNDIGLLTALTSQEMVRYQSDGQPGEAIVEPLTTYSVMRLKRTTEDGGRGIGVMATSTWRDMLDAKARAELPAQALSGGLDGWLTLDDDNVWAVRGYATGSYVRGTASAIDDLQLSSRRYFDRPQAPHISYDPQRTSLSGWAARGMLNKQSGNITLNTALGGVSPGYEINDLGFLYRSDRVNWHLATGYRWLEPNKLFRNRGFNLAAYKTWDFGGTPDAGGYGGFWHTVFANYWAIGGSVFYNPERNNILATRGGPIMRVPEHREFELWMDTDTRKAIYLNPWFSVWDTASGSNGWNVGCRVVVKPTSDIELVFEPRYNQYYDDSQWVTNQDDALMTATFGTRHVFADMDFHQLSIGTRINWTFTPKLTLQGYIQPLFATGNYWRLKEFARPNTYVFDVYGESNNSTVDRDENGDYVIDPDGDGPAEPFTVSDPNFNFKSLKVNIVLRWEYRPGSTFYLVWTQDRVDFADPGKFNVRRDARALVAAPGDNIFMAKLTYWFDL